MNNRPKRTAPVSRPATNRRLARPTTEHHDPVTIPARRFIPRKLDRPAFQRRVGPVFDSFLTLGLGIGVLVILGMALLIFETSFSSRITPHVSVDGIALGGVSL